ncbi:flagellin [Denitrobaculum tricleocarpae]|uniref:Flagellin n=1 Tax=Denitrobaculum tricleocarpae TaxID=2591009 RepID=A0A545T279_9PROT|nr:flagellin [Denitrobaculum tricleocarpae]TQV71316.1 flagellin [Denitrobaculum tricleocarpae]
MPVVATNTAANTATRFLNYNTNMASSSVGKLASGSRIVRASDDAAGLAIAARLNSDVVALQQASINASQGASMVQVADGGLNRIGDVLQRMKALAAASLSGVPTDNERAFIDAEYQELINEIDGIAATTRFNGDSLLDGTGTGSAEFFVGTDADDTIDVDFSALASVTNFTSATMTLTADVTTAANAETAMGQIDTAIDVISEARANAGAFISRFEFRGQQIATSTENIQAAESAISDVDLAAEQAKLVSSQVLVQASVSALSQANQIPQSLLRVLQ